MDVPTNHQRKIALNTLKLSKAGAHVLGGMNHREAVSFLRQIGYTNSRIIALLKKASHSESEIKEIME